MSWFCLVIIEILYMYTIKIVKRVPIFTLDFILCLSKKKIQEHHQSTKNTNQKHQRPRKDQREL